MPRTVNEFDMLLGQYAEMLWQEGDHNGQKEGYMNRSVVSDEEEEWTTSYRQPDGLWRRSTGAWGRIG